MENKIFTALLDSETSVEALALDWLSDYKEEANKAVSEVINFLLKSCGCDIPVQPHDIVHPDSAAETFSPIEEKARNHAGLEYAIISRKVTRFRHSFELFFMSIIENSAEDGILYYDELEEEDRGENIVFTLIKWLSPMSTAHLRSFRHTATVAALSMMTQLCELYSNRIGEVNKLTSELNQLKERRKGKGRVNANDKKKIAQKISELQDQVQVENEKASKILDAIQAATASVWAHRNRDVDPRIRVDCIKFLAKWISIVPEKFVDASSLKCFGSGLSDLESSVRTQVLSVLVSLFGSLYKEDSDSVAKGTFSQFVERYGGRIRQIAEHDVEESARKSAVSFITILNKLEILEEDEENANEQVLSKLIFDADEKVRKEAANYFISAVSRAVENLEISEDDTERIQEKMINFKTSWVFFKDIGLKFQSILEETDEKEDQVDEDFLLSNKRFESLPSRVAIASSSIWDVNRRRKENISLPWEALSDQLLYDFSSFDIPNIPDVDEGDITSYIEACTVDDTELQSILLEVLYGFIFSTIKSFSDTKLARKRGQGEVIDPQKSIDELNSTLIAFIPKLLEKFSYSDSAVAKVLRLNSLIDLESGFVKLHKESVYTGIIDIAVKSFRDSNTLEILRETEILFKRACHEGSSFASDVKLKLAETIDDLSYDIREKLGEVECSEHSLLESLAKIERLAPIIDIQDTIETAVQLPNNRNEILGQSLLDYVLKYQTDEIDQDQQPDRILFVKIVVNILRHYTISKFATLLSPTAIIQSEEMQRKDAAFISSVINGIEKLSVSTTGQDDTSESNITYDLRIFLKIVLLDIIISGWSAKIRGELTGQADFEIFAILPQKLSTQTINETMRLFLGLENLYLSRVGTPRNNIPDLDDLVDYNLTDNDSELESFSQLQLEYLICELASRIFVAASAGLWTRGADFVKRLGSNKGHISYRYVNLVRDISRQLPTPPPDDVEEEEIEEPVEDIEIDIENGEPEIIHNEYEDESMMID